MAKKKKKVQKPIPETAPLNVVLTPNITVQQHLQELTEEYTDSADEESCGLVALRIRIAAVTRLQLESIIWDIRKHFPQVAGALENWCLQPSSEHELADMKQDVESMQHLYKVVAKCAENDDGTLNMGYLMRVNAHLSPCHSGWSQFKERKVLVPREVFGYSVRDPELENRIEEIEKEILFRKSFPRKPRATGRLRVRLAAMTHTQLQAKVWELHALSPDVRQWLETSALRGPTEEEMNLIHEDLKGMRHVFKMVAESACHHFSDGDRGNPEVDTESQGRTCAYRLAWVNKQLARCTPRRQVMWFDDRDIFEPAVPDLELLKRAENVILWKKQAQEAVNVALQRGLMDFDFCHCLRWFGGGLLDNRETIFDYRDAFLESLHAGVTDALPPFSAAAESNGIHCCSYCGRIGKKVQMCQRCKFVGLKVRYCDKNCQERAWRTGHKKYCGCKTEA